MGPNSDSRAYGKFINGITSSGTLLPNDNQNANHDAAYSGGIGIESGVCLCTGLISDSDASHGVGRGIGVEGPNNGEPVVNAGEISTELSTPIDQDFDDFVFPNDPSDGGDATVLQFDVGLSAPGFLRIRFVFGSDEYPAFIQQQFNDSFGILIRKCGQFQNIATIKEPEMNPKPFSLQDIAGCAQLFKFNDVAPAPAALPASAHHIANAPWYDHEFGGFTKPLTRETVLPLSPGTYRLKIVIQDVGLNQSGNDHLVDSALFVEEDSLKLYALHPGDYNGDGLVDTSDYQVWNSHWGMTPATYYDGYGNGDCIVNAADYTVWRDHLGQTGNKDFCSDFNRDGNVNMADVGILATYYNVLEHCASRFEGDADGDGDVDDCDLDILIAEYNSGVPTRPCACGGGGGATAMMAAADAVTAGSGDLAELKSRLPASPDLDNNGSVATKNSPRLIQSSQIGWGQNRPMS